MAVYTDVSDEDIARFVAEYDIGTVISFKGIAEGVENTNFLLQTDQASFILTLYEKRVNPDDLPFYLGLMDHLSAKGLNCPTPIHGKDGVALRRLCGRPAAITSFLNGMSPRRIMPHHCTGLGAALAHLHTAGQDFDMYLGNALSVKGWHPLFESCRADANGVQPGLEKLIEDELADVRSLADQGYAPISRVRALERQAAALDGEAGSLRAEIARANEAMGEARLQMSGVGTQMDEDVSEQLRAVEVQLNELQPRLAEVRAQIERNLVRAPVSGQVVGLTIFTAGGVIQAGQTLMEIVPSNASQVIVARVNPQDVDNLQVGYPFLSGTPAQSVPRYPRSRDCRCYRTIGRDDYS